MTLSMLLGKTEMEESLCALLCKTYRAWVFRIVDTFFESDTQGWVMLQMSVSHRSLFLVATFL